MKAKKEILIILLVLLESLFIYFTIKEGRNNPAISFITNFSMIGCAYILGKYFKN